MNSSIPSGDNRAFFDALAARRERDEKLHRTYYDDRHRWLTRFIPQHARIIEVGCGTGLSLSRLPQETKTGIDFSPEMIRIAQQRDPHTTYIVDDVLKLQHAETYDYVLLLDTINFVGDVQQTLANIRTKLCHNRSRLIVTYYNFLWYPLFAIGHWLGLKTRFPEQNWLNTAAMENLLRLTGFEVIQTGNRILCPFYIPLLTAFFNKYLISLPLIRKLALVHTMVARPIPMKRTERSVTVLSAVRNEKGNIQQIISGMPAMGTQTELLFIEGHSTDGTWEELERAINAYKGPLRIRALKQSGKGKANALHEGVTRSSGEILFIYDGDYTVHPAELQKLYDVIADGRAEFVNASRLVYPLQEGSMRPLNLIGNKAFSVLFSWLFQQRLSDVLSPVKGMFRSDYDAVSTRLDPFGDFDFFLGAGSRQLKMCEVPVHYLERSYGVTKIRRFHHGWLLLKMCFFGAKKLRWI